MLTLSHVHVLHAQVSIRANEKMASLSRTSFKKSNSFYVIERATQQQLWTCMLPPSHPSVRAYAVRDKRDYPNENALDHGDIIDDWLERWEAGAWKASPTMPKNDARGMLGRMRIDVVWLGVVIMRLEGDCA